MSGNNGGGARASQYVPPHLRNSAGGQERQQSSGGERRFARGDARGDVRGGSRDFGGRGDFDRRGGGRGYGGGRDFGGRGFGGRGRGGRGGRMGGRMQAELSPDRDERYEKELFGDVTQSQTQGIDFSRYDDIPVELSEEYPELDNFANMELSESLANAIKLCGYTKPTPVQKYSVPVGTDGRDIMACAQTGSGKTAGFLLPVIERMCRMKAEGQVPPAATPQRGGRDVYSPTALIIAPVRELGQQIVQHAKRLMYRSTMRAVCIVGGEDFGSQMRRLGSAGAELIVCTPGRLKDMITRGRMNMEHVRFLILDEADRMLDMGFEDDIRYIVEDTTMPRTDEGRQTMLFSATFPDDIQHLAQDFMAPDYVFLTVGRVGSTIDLITQQVEYAAENQKMDVLLEKLATCEGLTLIFVQTKRSADEIEYYLRECGLRAQSIHGDRSQQEREHALSAFRSKRCPVLVATDVAARGLDIPDVKFVINFDLPQNIDTYTHRIGRTGRCGHHGTAISFVNEGDRNLLAELLGKLQECEQVVPDWFDTLVRDYSGRRGRGRGGGRNRGRNYGGRDVRSGGRGGNQGGGGGGWGNRWGNSGW